MTRFAALDLGSNSFHMLIADFNNDQLEIVDKKREMVQLGLGLDDKNRLSQAAISRALNCLTEMGELIREHQPHALRVVGTATLRKAVNGVDLINYGEQLLGAPIEIISGKEESELIYLGVRNTTKVENSDKILVIDIGGRSTEFVLGTGDKIDYLASVDMGCIAATKLLFPNDYVDERRLRHGCEVMQQLLSDLDTPFQQLDDVKIIGASGTIRAVKRVFNHEGVTTNRKIPNAALKQLSHRFVGAKNLQDVQFPDLCQKRIDVFSGGAVWLNEIFTALKIESMHVSKGALREGICYQLFRRHREEVLTNGAL